MMTLNTFDKGPMYLEHQLFLELNKQKTKNIKIKLKHLNEYFTEEDVRK